MDLLAAAARRQETHGDLCNLVAGQPSTGAPVAVREEAKRLLDADHLGYTVSTGIRPLREAVAQHHRTRSGIEVEADDVVITTGSSGGFVLAFLAAFDPGRDRAAFERGGPCAEGDYDTIRLVCLALTPRDGFSGLIDTAACRLPARRVP